MFVSWVMDFHMFERWRADHAEGEHTPKTPHSRGFSCWLARLNAEMADHHLQRVASVVLTLYFNALLRVAIFI